MERLRVNGFEDEALSNGSKRLVAINGLSSYSDS